MIDERTQERFWSHVDKSAGPDGCWLWVGICYPNGYGLFNWKDKNHGAHRISWEIAHGSIPGKLFVCHSCDVRACVNQSHLFLGTCQDNMLDAARKGRTAKGDRHSSRTHPERVARGDRHGSKTHPEKIPRGDHSGSHLHPETRAYGDRNGSRLYPERLKRGHEQGTYTHPETRQYGERNCNHKLTTEQVLEIRAICAMRTMTQEQIAKIFNVSRPTICDIIARRTWKHL